jgi:hypothetical protein
MLSIWKGSRSCQRRWQDLGIHRGAFSARSSFAFQARRSTSDATAKAEAGSCWAEVALRRHVHQVALPSVLGCLESTAARMKNGLRPLLDQDGHCLEGACRFNAQKHNGSCSYPIAAAHGSSFLS